MGSVLFVCTANICRSPMAMALFREMASKDPDMRDWRIESAGTWALDGQPASALGELTMAHRGLDLSDHRSREVNADLLKQFDLILTMEDRHREALQAEFPELASRIFQLSEMAGRRENVDDPYGMTEREYEDAVEHIQQLLGEGLDEIVRRVRLQSKSL